MSRKGDRNNIKGTRSEIKSGESESYSSDPWSERSSFDKFSAAGAVAESSSQGSNPSSSKSEHESYGDRTSDEYRPNSDEERLTHRSGNKITYDRDDSSDIDKMRKSGRSRKEADVFSISDMEKSDEERLTHRSRNKTTYEHDNSSDVDEMKRSGRSIKEADIFSISDMEKSDEERLTHRSGNKITYDQDDSSDIDKMRKPGRSRKEADKISVSDMEKSDEERVTHRSRNKITYGLDDNSDIDEMKRSGRSTKEADVFSISEMKKSDEERLTHRSGNKITYDRDDSSDIDKMRKSGRSRKEGDKVSVPDMEKSDEERVTHRSRNKIICDRDDNSDIDEMKRSGRLRKEADVFSISDMEKSDEERLTHRSKNKTTYEQDNISDVDEIGRSGRSTKEADILSISDMEKSDEERVTHRSRNKMTYDRDDNSDIDEMQISERSRKEADVFSILDMEKSDEERLTHRSRNKTTYEQDNSSDVDEMRRSGRSIKEADISISDMEISDEEMFTHRSRNKITYDRDNSSTIDDMRRSRKEKDRFSIVESDSNELKQRDKNDEYNSKLWVLDSPESQSDFKESRPTSPIHRDQKSVPTSNEDDVTDSSDDDLMSQSTVRRQGAPIRYKELPDKNANSPDLSKAEEVVHRNGNPDPNRRFVGENLNKVKGLEQNIRRDVKETTTPDKEKDESNHDKMEKGKSTVRRQGAPIRYKELLDKNADNPDLSKTEEAVHRKGNPGPYRRSVGENLNKVKGLEQNIRRDVKETTTSDKEKDESNRDKMEKGRSIVRRKGNPIRYKELPDKHADKPDFSKAEEVDRKGIAAQNQKSVEENLDKVISFEGNEEKDAKDQSNQDKIDKSDPGHQKWWFVGQKSLFGLGHVYNDLCAAMWFSYMMLFFEAVIKMKGVISGYMMLLGQVVDALFTPIVGMLIDRFYTKKQWHLMGSVQILSTFPFLFIRCPGCKVDGNQAFKSWWAPLYYGSFIFWFQIGWAIVQISHLAMIPDLSENSNDRAELTSIRTMATMASSLLVYTITWIILKSTKSFIIGPADDYKFRNIVLIITAIGGVVTILFHVFFKIKPKEEVKAEGSVDLKKTKFSIIYFLKLPLLYFTSLLYVFSRLYWALSLIYTPLFLEERLKKNRSSGSEQVASVPMVVYITSFTASLLLKKYIHLFGNQIAYFAGSCVSILSCVWIALFIHPFASIVHVYFVAILIGAGSATTQVSSLSITADMIGTHAKQGGVVYSIVTFADKLITGIAVVVVEHIKCEDLKDCPEFYRAVLSYVCGGCALLGIVVLVVQIGMAKYARTVLFY